MVGTKSSEPVSASMSHGYAGVEHLPDPDEPNS